MLHILSHALVRDNELLNCQWYVHLTENTILTYKFYKYLNYAGLVLENETKNAVGSN